jgi:hypothetical protein
MDLSRGLGDVYKRQLLILKAIAWLNETIILKMARS